MAAAVIARSPPAALADRSTRLTCQLYTEAALCTEAPCPECGATAARQRTEVARGGVLSLGARPLPCTRLVLLLEDFLAVSLSSDEEGLTLPYAFFFSFFILTPFPKRLTMRAIN